MKKAKEFRKELETLTPEEAVDYLVPMCREFLNEYNMQVATKGKTENICSGILRELDMKFQASVPVKHKEQKMLLREVILETHPQLKKAMMW